MGLELANFISSNPLILENIFSNLQPSDIKTVALVSRYWRSTVENPKFWSWASFRIDAGNINEVLTSERLRIITRASLECSGDICFTGLDSFLQFYLHISYMLRTEVVNFQLKSLKISANLEEDETRDSLAEVICNVEEVDLTESDIKSANLFERIASYEDLRLKHLIVNNINISSLPQELISQSLRKIEEVNICNSSLRYTQLNQLFQDLEGQGDSSLRRLDLSQNNLSYFFQPAGLCQLEEVRLCQVFITDRTLTTILSSISQSTNLKLKHLDLSDNNLSKLPPSSLADAAVKLEKLSVSRSKMKAEQITELFSRLRDQPDSKLKSLDISNNRLASLPAGMLSGVLSRLQEANVANTRLNTEQVAAIFSEILSIVPLQLKYLNISYNNLSSLPLPTLRQAVSLLEQINLISCRLDLHHVLSLDLKDFAQKYI